MYKLVEINSEKNMLLCSSSLVGKDELVEIHTPGPDTPSQVLSNVLQKTKDPDFFVVRTAFSNEMVGKEFKCGEKCVMRVLRRSLSGVRRRKFGKDEKEIVDLEKGVNWKEKKINRAKTGSVRNRRKKKKK